MDSIPDLKGALGGGNGNPLQYSCLKNPMDRGAWQGPSDCEELDMTEHACILSLAQECYCPSHAQVGLLWLMNVSNRDAEAGAVQLTLWCCCDEKGKLELACWS